MSLTLTIDAREVEKLFARLDKSFTSFAPEMKQIGQQMARSTDITFKSGGRPGPFAPLSPSTVGNRRRKARLTGKQPVAGFETPLRETDRLRRSLVDTNAPGSESYTNDKEAVQGTSEPQARRLQQGAGTMPAREFLVILPADSAAYQNIIGKGIQVRVVQASRGVK